MNNLVEENKAKAFLEDLRSLCEKHSVSIRGVGYSGGVQVEGAFKMVGLGASSDAASGDLNGKLSTPTLTAKLVDNEEIVVLRSAAVISNIGTFIGVRNDGTSEVIRGDTTDDLIVKACRQQDEFSKALKKFKAINNNDLDDEVLEFKEAVEKYFDFLTKR